MLRRLNMAQGSQSNHAPGKAEGQRQPQGAHFANMRNGETRNIAAEHADADGIDRPEPTDGRAGVVAFDVMDNRHDKRVEEQRIGEAADAVEKQDQRIVGVTEAENEEQHVEYAPQHEANHHRFQRGDNFRHHAGNPRRQRGGQAVEGKGKGGLRRREAERFDIVRQKG